MVKDRLKQCLVHMVPNAVQTIVLGLMGIGLIYVVLFPPVVELTYDKDLDHVKVIRYVGRPDRSNYRDDIKRDMLLFIELNSGEKIIFQYDRSHQMGEFSLITAIAALLCLFFSNREHRRDKGAGVDIRT